MDHGWAVQKQAGRGHRLLTGPQDVTPPFLVAGEPGEPEQSAKTMGSTAETIAAALIAAGPASPPCLTKEPAYRFRLPPASWPGPGTFPAAYARGR